MTLRLELVERIGLGPLGVGDEVEKPLREVPADRDRCCPGPASRRRSPSVSTSATSMPSIEVPLMTPIAVTRDAPAMELARPLGVRCDHSTARRVV